ncbi:MAG: ABC transporter permease [SAR324 cluster bacterium]|nr:ABC transporter permease [SAR324 cluster bacterium]
MSKESLSVLATTLLSLVAAFFVSAVIILILGENPVEVFKVFIVASLFSWDGVGFTLFYMTPLLLTGLSVSMAFKGGLFNIGAEGQLYMGSMAVAIFAGSGINLPFYLMIPICILLAFLAGGIWGVIPGYLKVKFGSHEVINTIMLNLIAYGICNYLVVGPFKRQGDQILETEFIAQSARVFRLNKIIPWISESVPVNFALLLTISLCVGYWYFFHKMRYGYEMQVSGHSSEVARYAGINSGRYIILSMFIAGGLAGLVAVHEVMGFRYTFHDNFSRGVGFMGIAVALLGRNNPLGIFMAAFLFGMMNRGSLFIDINFDKLSNDLVIVVQGVIILFAAMSGMFQKLVRSK